MNVFVGVLLAMIPGDVWPGFLGVGATLPSEQNVALEWSPTRGVAWQSPIVGHGQSSPVIWNGRIFVSTIDGPKKEKCIVAAYSLKDGKQEWAYTSESSDPVENSVYVSRAAPTPVVDDSRLIVFFESGDIVSLSHDGKELWKRSLSSEYGKYKNKFGIGSSPIQNKDSVFILIDDEGPSYLASIDKKTGNTVWKKDRKEKVSWSSPGFVRVGEMNHVVVSSAGAVDGYDATNGDLLWSYSEVGGNTGTSPFDLGQGRFFVAASAGREGENTELAKKSNMLMQIEKTESGWQAKPKWLNVEATPSWASPIEHAGCAYWISRVGVVYCIDSESGKLHYKQRTKQSCWATPVGVGDRVYFFGKDGVTTVLAAGPEFKVLAENVLWDPEAIQPPVNAGANEATEERRRAAAMFSGPTVYGVAIADGNVVIRVGDRLYCVRK
jgi:outer membrane protein assembly factor BamB